MLVKPRTARDDDDRGSAIVSVLIVTLVLGLLAVTLSAAVIATTRTTVDVRGSLQAQAAADAGIAAAVAAAKATPAAVCAVAPRSTSAPRYEVTTACTAGTGRATFTSTGHGEDGGEVTVEATYQYAGGIGSAAPENAMFIGGNGLTANELVVRPGADAGDAAALILRGDFMTCNNTTTFATDVIIYSGSIQLTNSCTFEKNLYVAGNVELNSAITVKGSIHAMGSVRIENNTATVLGDVNAKGAVRVLGKIQGNVKTEGALTMPSNGSIGGSATVGGSATLTSNSKITGTLTANGKVTMGGGSTVAKVVAGGALEVNNATVTGELISASTDPAALYSLRAGSVLVAGAFAENFQASTITGDAVSTRPGVQSFIAPDTKIGGALRLAGTASTKWGPPTATQGNFYNVTGLVAPQAPTKPTVEVPEQLRAGTTWDDYAFDAEQWVANGYRVVTWPSSNGCSFDAWSTGNVSALTSHTSPTVVDLRACTEVKAYAARLAFKTDILLVLPDSGKTHDFQDAIITSADGQPHRFSILVPDTADDDLPTCRANGTTVKLYATTLGESPRMSGLVYTPCTLSIGIGGGKGNWNGQFYVGAMTFGGSGAPGYQFVYQPITIPAFGDGAITPPSLGGLLTRRDVPTP